MSFISSLLFLYFVSARLSNTEGEGVVEYNMYVSTHVSLFCVCIVFVFCYMLLSKEEIKKEECQGALSF